MFIYNLTTHFSYQASKNIILVPLPKKERKEKETDFYLILECEGTSCCASHVMYQELMSQEWHILGLESWPSQIKY
jgi:hypothetical protein